MSRPGGNVTGTSLFTSALGPKRLEILREVVPQASVVGFLQDPQGLHALYTATELESAAHKIGVRIVVVHASVENDLDAVFAKLVSAGAQGLILNADATFFGWQNRLVMLTARHAIPTISIARVYARAGLLMSYGTSDISELYRQAAGYVARVLKGEKPADLPVQGPTKFELVVNLNPIAKAVETMLQAEP
jgi:putative ABC transport system substrate-binding protein